MPPIPHCKPCQKKFATARAAYMHWRSVHARYKLQGDGERAVLDALAAVRKDQTHS